MLERKQCVECKSMRPLCGFDRKPSGKGQLKDKCIFCAPPEVKVGAIPLTTCKYCVNHAILGKGPVK